MVTRLVVALLFVPVLLFSQPGSFVEKEQAPRILVCYYSVTGNTRAMAEAVANGARSVEGSHVILKSVSDVTMDELHAADAIIVGSPVYNAAVAPQVQEFINRWPFKGSPMKNKIGAAFVTGGGISAGEELVQLSILHSMLIFGMIVVGGEDWRSAFGASAITDEQPFRSDTVDEHFLRKGEALGRRVAGIAQQIKGFR